eukprot:scaffold4776_cov137-Skeletonema_menzelii.AAC.4
MEPKPRRGVPVPDVCGFVLPAKFRCITAESVEYLAPVTLCIYPHTARPPPAFTYHLPPRSL